MATKEILKMGLKALNEGLSACLPYARAFSPARERLTDGSTLVDRRRGQACEVLPYIDWPVGKRLQHPSLTMRLLDTVL